jgi:glycosyltransferase involved in cell wall biosynthesis
VTTVDVVVVTHNSAAHLDDALAPLLASRPTGAAAQVASVVVVDNASGDDSVARARHLGATVVAGRVNAGFAAAANRGAATGSGEVILFLNPDAAVEPEQLHRLVDDLVCHPDCGVVAARLEGSGGPQRTAWPFPSVAGAWREALGWDRSEPRPAPGEIPGFVVGACFLVRRGAFEALGGFDERFWLYGEEADLCRRMRDGGWSVRIADAVASHVGGASATGIEDLVFEHFQRGSEHFVAKHEGPDRLWRFRLAEVVGSVVRAAAPGPASRRAYHRRRLARLARVLVSRPAEVGLDSPATAAPGAALVVCSLEAWDQVWRRNQLLVRELLAADPDRRVLFVEPAFDALHERRHPSGRVRLRGLVPLEGHGRVVRFEPVKWWPRLVGPFADASLRRQVTRAAARLGFERPDLWINDPSYAGLVRDTGWPATYDITDDWTRAAASPRARRRVRANERRLFADCGSVVVCSPGLAVSRRPARPDLVVIPNAVDVEHFRAPRPRPVDLPDPAEGPVAVYVGTLHTDRLDVDLVVRLATERPDLAVVLVGPDSLDADAAARLATRPNVHRLGARAYAAVPGYLQHADVVIVPHVVTPFTESLDPIKAYECRAVGRPTVATPVAGFRSLGPPVVCAPAESFVAEVGRVLAEPPALGPGPGPGPELAGWADRARQFAAQLEAPRRYQHPGPVVAGHDGPARPRLRVAFVDHCAQLSGGEIALARLLGALDQVEDGPIVEAQVILGEDGPLVSRLEGLGVAVEVLALDTRVGHVRRGQVTARALGPARVAALAGDVVALTRRLRRLHPDVVHTNSLKAALYGGVAARLAGVPVVWHIRDRIATDYLPAPAVRGVRALARRLPDAIIVNSVTTRDTLGPVVAAGRTPVHVVHDMVDHPVSSADRAAGPDRAEHGGPVRVAMIGRLAPWKGQDVFLDAFAQAFGPAPSTVRAWVVGAALFGEDDFTGELVARAQRLGIADQVSFVGFTDDVAGVLAEVDVVVHASVIAEPFGQVVVEAMAAGVAVVAADLGGPAEVVTDGVDGLLSPPGDVGALAERLTRLAGDPDLRRRLGRAGAATARAFYPEVVAPRLVACLVEAAGWAGPTGAEAVVRGHRTVES